MRRTEQRYPVRLPNQSCSITRCWREDAIASTGMNVLPRRSDGARGNDDAPPRRCSEPTEQAVLDMESSWDTAPLRTRGMLCASLGSALDFSRFTVYDKGRLGEIIREGAK
jgi:hypothetical protein